jgi:hypothetical protein
MGNIWFSGNDDPIYYYYTYRERSNLEHFPIPGTAHSADPVSFSHDQLSEPFEQKNYRNKMTELKENYIV